MPSTFEHYELNEHHPMLLVLAGLQRREVWQFIQASRCCAWLGRKALSQRPVPREGDVVLKLERHYAYLLAHGTKRHEVRSRSWDFVTPGTWVWFATLSGQVNGVAKSAIVGRGRYVGKHGPLNPFDVGAEAVWRSWQHCIETPLREWVTLPSMPDGYKKQLFAYEFADAFDIKPVSSHGKFQSAFGRHSVRACRES